MIEWESAALSEESRLDFARGLAIVNLSYTNLEKREKDKIAKELETAPPEVVERYLPSDFTPATLIQKVIEVTVRDTPATCVGLLLARIRTGRF